MRIIRDDEAVYKIDAYTRRILSRIGYELPKTYDQFFTYIR
ncbi:MAG: hypothetical protein PHV56_02245 [Clostridia bacterium]|jgi:endonuclease III-like uncharacterized protein|nr:hypothetical protein [Clostridia bacterium]